MIIGVVEMVLKLFDKSIQKQEQLLLLGFVEPIIFAYQLLTVLFFWFVFVLDVSVEGGGTQVTFATNTDVIALRLLDSFFTISCFGKEAIAVHIVKVVHTLKIIIQSKFLLIKY